MRTNTTGQNTQTINPMKNAIEKIFTAPSTGKAESGKRLKLMTHVVAGYPDLETNERLIRTMAENGADLVEIQIPFSDPLADGPTISTANQAALENGVTPGDCFRLAERLREKVDIPLLFMTYTNIPFRTGFKKFAQSCRDAGVSGLIIPDLPLDEGREHLDIIKTSGLYTIPVVSPGMSDQRLAAATGAAAGFIYATLRVGITGARHQADEKGLIFLDKIRSCTELPIAAGFGISSVQMVKHLEETTPVEAVVIGSHIIDLVNREGINAVGHFIRKIKQ